MLGSEPANFLSIVSSTLSNTERRADSVSVITDPSLACGTRMDDHGAVAVREHAAPQLRHGLRTELGEHLQFGVAERRGHVRAGGQSRVELTHGREAELVVGRPEVGNYCMCPRRQEWPDEARDAVLAMDGAGARVARGEGDETRMQAEFENLARLEQAVVGYAGSEQQRGPGRYLGAENAV